MIYLKSAQLKMSLDSCMQVLIQVVNAARTATSISRFNPTTPRYHIAIIFLDDEKRHPSMSSRIFININMFSTKHKSLFMSQYSQKKDSVDDYLLNCASLGSFRINGKTNIKGYLNCHSSFFALTIMQRQNVCTYTALCLCFFPAVRHCFIP